MRGVAVKFACSWLLQLRSHLSNLQALLQAPLKALTIDAQEYVYV